MDSEILTRLLDAVCPIAVTAGKAILPIAAEVGDVETKADGSPLTRADVASHNVIQTGLESLEPKFPILSEEGDPDQTAEAWMTFWCVDPLDGTKEFVKGLDEYTVNIALIDRGVPILGVVYVPAKNVLYYAGQGLGAWEVEAGGEPKRIAASSCDRPSSAVVSRSHLSDETKLFLEKLGVTEMISHGSSIKLCAVAEGKANRGVLMCGSGIGMCMTANKVAGIRAALCHDELTVEMSRRHNDANVLCMGGDLLGDELMRRMVEIWMGTEFEGGRHERRVRKVMKIEEGGLEAFKPKEKPTEAHPRTSKSKKR